MTSGRIGISLALVALTSMLSHTGCIAEDERFRQEVMNRIAGLETDRNESIAIRRLGPRAVPYVAEAILKPDATPRQELRLIFVLGWFGDRRAVPALVKVADASPVTEVTDEIIRSELSPESISLEARSTIARILDPTPGRFGENIASFPDPYPPKTVAVQKNYFSNVNKWYNEWRTTYDEKAYVGNCPSK